jgi:hypothetical protein
MEYNCDKCGKLFALKTDLQRHLNRKLPCDRLKDNKCKFCEKSYSNENNMKRHMKNCKKKDSNIINITGDATDKSIIANSAIANSVNSNINTTQINNPIIINIVPFLGEDMSKLTEKDKVKILKKCYMSIPELIKQVNLNPNLPENHNVYISNIKSKYGHVNDGQKWILTKVDQLIDDLVSKKKDDIEELLDEYEDQIPDKVVDKIRDVIASIEYDPLSDDSDSAHENKEKKKFKKRILEEVKLLLYNNKDIPHATRKQNEKQEQLAKSKKNN